MNIKHVSAAFLLFCAAAVEAAPQVIAHRGGTGDAPENTLPAIEKALNNHADAIWITVQLSKDGVPVLYRPSDLSSLTNLKGKVSEFTAEQLAKADAAINFGTPDSPYRNKNIGIPTLKQALTRWPDTFFYLDIKSPDAVPADIANAIHRVLSSSKALQRTRIYSTDSRFLAALPPDVARFESRDITRTLLANVTMGHQCGITAEDSRERWYGLELQSQVEVVEKFTLGEGRSKATVRWDDEAMSCFRSQPGAHIILLGINDAESYQQAVKLGADGVLVNSPLMIAGLK